MHENEKILVRVLEAAILIAVAAALVVGRNKERDKPLACLAMTSADSSFTCDIARELEKRLALCGNRVLISYCDNDIDMQIRQIEDYIAMKPEVLVIDSMGNERVYDKILKRTQGAGIQVIALSSSGNMETADIQMVSSKLGRGICASVLIRDFLDRTDTPADSLPVKVLLLGNASTEREIMTMAGYQLIAEKFVRQYDMNSRSFVKEEAGTVYYTDGYGKKHQVKEPTGGLILDENGEAVLNLYYEPRIRLITADNYMNIQNNLQGQKAIDAFLGDSENRDVRIVVATSGEAAVGAASRLEACLTRGELTYNSDQIAVFGAYNSEQNRTLVAKAAKGQGIFRGFVGDFSIIREADNIIRSLLTGRKGTYHCYSFYSGYSPVADETGIVTLNDYGISDMDLFREENEG